MSMIIKTPLSAEQIASRQRRLKERAKAKEDAQRQLETDLALAALAEEVEKLKQEKSE